VVEILRFRMTGFRSWLQAEHGVDSGTRGFDSGIAAFERRKSRGLGGYRRSGLLRGGQCCNGGL
jgi:hypothetical protein